MEKTARGFWRWLAKNLRPGELHDFSAHELERMAGEVGVSVDELNMLSARGPNAASRLPRRLEALGLNSENLASKHSIEYRDMQRRCALCSHHGRCGRDLSRDPQGAAWQSYCPNTRSILAYGEITTPVSS